MRTYPLQIVTWTSSFKITQVVSSIAFQLKLPKQWKIHNVFYASLLSSYRETPEHSPNFPQPPPELIRTKEEYKIDKIINHWCTATRRQYLIHWKGYSNVKQTWELESNLGNALVMLKKYKNQWGLWFSPWLHTSNCFSSPSPTSPKPLPKLTSKSNTQNLMFQNIQWNTSASATLPPAPITAIIRPMVTPFFTWLDHLFPFTWHLLYATILKSTIAYQALHALPYFSVNDTLTQLVVLFQIYSTLCTLFTRATWCSAGAPNPFWTAITWESPTILTLEQCLLKAQELILNLLYVKGFNYAISLLPSPIINVVLSPIVLLLLESKQSTLYADNPLFTGLSWAYQVAATFSNNSLAINVNQGSLID